MSNTSTPAKMNRLNRDELRSLSSAERRPSVSLYMPTHRAGKEIRQDPIRLKNLISEAAKQLAELTLEDEQIDTILDFATSLPKSETDGFWQQSSDGLALFQQDGFARAYRVPVRFDELVVVAERFHLKPLVNYLQGNGHFYVLAVSSNRVRLFEGGKHQLTEIDTEILPENLVDALNIDEYVSSLQFHSHTADGAGAAADANAIYHGHGAGSDADKKEELLKYFRKLDDAIDEFMGIESAPLVFAGVEYLFPIYQQANNYRSLVDQPVTGNHDDASADELHAQAWEIVEPQFTRQRDGAIEKYATLAARDQATDDVNKVVKAAREGRVETILLAEGVRRWGTVADDGTTTQTDENTAESEDLLDHAAVHALQSGGDVFLLDQSSMPTDSPAAAILRY